MSSETPPQQPSNGISKTWFWGEILLLVALFFVSSPAPPPGVNEPHYLCRLRHAVDPNYCPGDLFLESPDAHFTFVWAFAWLTRLFTFETVAWIGRIGCWLALAWAWLRLSWRIVPRPLYATLAATIVISAIAEGNFAGEWLVGGFEAKTVAYVFVFLGLTSWIDRQWNLVWIYLGVASAWHALVGGWSVLILLTLWCVGYRTEQPLRGMLPGLAAGGVIALAGVWPALQLNAGAPPEVRSEAAQIYVFERLPHHLAPLHKKPAWIAERAFRHATIVTLLVAMLLANRAVFNIGWRELIRSPTGKIVQYAVGAMVLAMIGLVLEWMLWNAPAVAASWLRYYWFRLVDVAVPVALALLWIRLLEALLRRSDRLATPLLAITLLLAGFPVADQYIGFLMQPQAVANKKVADAQDWREVCHWIESKTPTDAMFLTPRGNTSFKWYAQRAEVVTFKDVPQDARNLVEWRRRLYDVFSYEEDGEIKLANRPGVLGNRRVAELVSDYGVDYILDRHYPPLRYPIVHMNQTYVVYEVDDRQRD